MFQTTRIGYKVITRSSSFLTSINGHNYSAVRSLHAFGNWMKAVPASNNLINSANYQIRYETTSSSPPPADWKKLKNEDWAERLTPEAYFCTREGGTEPPFSGQYVNHKAEGVYKCVCCGSDLFTSKAKYDSGSGWPSFHSPAEETRVIRRKDISHGMVRIEILCANCNSHLGHVFDDGPEPTGQRFCVNSVSLKFNPKKIN